MTPINKELLEALECLLCGHLNDDVDNEDIEQCYAAITRAQSAETVDIETLKRELVEYLMKEFGFNNPNNDAQKLAMLCCDMWTHHLIERGLIAAGKGE